MPVLLGPRLREHGRGLLCRLLPGKRLLRIVSGSELAAARRAAARVWRYRHHVELEAAERFRRLAEQLATFGASETVVRMARRASSDELRHAELCSDLVAHFGATVGASKSLEVRPVGPSALDERDRLLYEVVALSCVTETLSTALLGALVERARDSVARGVLHSILCDEVDHSRLGWAFVAEEHARGARDCVSEWLAAMLSSTLSEDLFTASGEVSAVDRALAGFGSLERTERRRIVRETLCTVIFPGLERFGFDTSRGKTWLAEHAAVRT